MGIDFEIKLPHVAFHRHQGEFSAIKPTRWQPDFGASGTSAATSGCRPRPMATSSTA
jgi:hypothetical protein